MAAYPFASLLVEIVLQTIVLLQILVHLNHKYLLIFLISNIKVIVDTGLSI